MTTTSRRPLRAKREQVIGGLSLALALWSGVARGQSQGADAPKPDARAVIREAQSLPPGGVDEVRSVEIGGIRQWISIKGASLSNPILLFLHGGPGSPMMPESWTFQRPWEDFFTVVQWDQRGSGKTFASNPGEPASSLTISRMQSDAEALIHLLQASYHKPKIFLMGHSWGSILGLRIAQHRPDDLYAYIGVGQVVSGRENEAVGYQETLAEAHRVGAAEAVKALEAIAPYPEPDGSVPLSKIVVERRWDRALGGMIYGKAADPEAQVRALSPDYSDADRRAAEAGELASVQALLPQMGLVDFHDFNVYREPIFFFAGASDRTTPASLVEAYYASLSAPEKRLFIIGNAAHYVVNEAPGEVLVDLVRYIRPLAGVEEPDADGGEARKAR